jgi:hypothetical protein
MQGDTQPEATKTRRLLELGVAALIGTALLAGCLVFVVLVAGAVALAASGRAPGGWLFPVLLVGAAVAYWGLVYRVETAGYADWNDDTLAELEDWDADWNDDTLAELEDWDADWEDGDAPESEQGDSRSTDGD